MMNPHPNTQKLEYWFIGRKGSKALLNEQLVGGRLYVCVFGGGATQSYVLLG